jgi:hypothetical protein
MGIIDRIKHAWNAFIGLDQPNDEYTNRYTRYIDYGQSFTYRPDRVVLKRTSGKSIVGSIYNRIAIDCSSVEIKHVKTDKNGRYLEAVNSGLNECLIMETNKDQTPKMFIRDIIISMFDEGCVAVVPIDTTKDITDNNAYDILSMRVGKITQWYSDHIEVEVYNDRTGNKQTLTLPKNKVAIIENPLSAIMNEPNSTLQRLIHKLALLDVVDEQSGSGKLDLIIQLPYIIKSEARKKQADERRDDIATQLRDSKYGIAYTDGTEKITQLNRPLENNLMKQVEYLTSMLFSQLGITESILNGTANEDVMLNYFSRTVKPIMDAIVDEMKRKFLTKTARTQLQTIMYFNDPFKLVTVTKLAEIADSLTRNEVMSSNEIRQVMGLRPVDDPRADELRNKNLNDPKIQNGTNSTQINSVDVPEQANEITSRDDMLKQFIERRKKKEV